MLIICSECGKEYSDQAKRCPHCGAITSQNRYISNNIKSYQNNANIKNDSSWLFAIIIFLCVLLFGIVFNKKDSEIIGYWKIDTIESSQASGEIYATYIFNEDGTGSVGVYGINEDSTGSAGVYGINKKFTYKVKNKKISITIESTATFEIEYSIKNNKLYLGDNIICTKVK